MTQKDLAEEVRKTEQAKDLLLNPEIISTEDSTDEKLAQENSQDCQELHLKDSRYFVTQFVPQECEKSNENNCRSLCREMEPTNTNLDSSQKGNSVNTVAVAKEQTGTFPINQSSCISRNYNTLEDRKKSTQQSHNSDGEPMVATLATNYKIKEQELTTDEKSKCGNFEKSPEKIKIKEGPCNQSAATEPPVKVKNFASFFFKCNFRFVFIKNVRNSVPVQVSGYSLGVILILSYYLLFCVKL